MEVILVDFDGVIMARAARTRSAEPQVEEHEPFVQRIARSDAELQDTPERIEDE